VSRRSEQVAEEIRRHISELLLLEVRDPRVGMATVTSVDVSPDLKHARVHLSVLGEEQDERETLSALRRMSGFLRSGLGRRMTLRYVPELRFEPDPTTRQAIRISELLDEVGASDDPDKT
jgi:ribosome-binding factor A